MKCNIKRCKAACCYNVPLPKKILSVYRNKIVNPIIRILDAGKSPKMENMEFVLPLTGEGIENNKCPFLRADCRCNIYPNRPHLCRIFGEENVKDKEKLRCEYRI